MLFIYSAFSPFVYILLRLYTYTSVLDQTGLTHVKSVVCNFTYLYIQMFIRIYLSISACSSACYSF